MTTVAEETYLRMRDALGSHAALAIGNYVTAILAESRPSSEPPATAGGAPSDEELIRIYEDALRATRHHTRDKWFVECLRALYEAGERAERAACARLAAHHSDEIADVIRDRGTPPAPPPPAPAEPRLSCEPDDPGRSDRDQFLFHAAQQVVDAGGIAPADKDTREALDCLNAGLYAVIQAVRGDRWPKHAGDGEPPAPAEKCPEPLPERLPIHGDVYPEESLHIVDRFSNELGCTIRDCLDCGCLVPGGPTRCKRCAREAYPHTAPTQATGTADPDATGQGAEASDEELEALLAVYVPRHHYEIAATLRRRREGARALFNAGAASLAPKLEAYERRENLLLEFVDHMDRSCAYYPSKAPLIRERVERLRRELSAGTTGKDG